QEPSARRYHRLGDHLEHAIKSIVDIGGPESEHLVPEASRKVVPPPGTQVVNSGPPTLPSPRSGVRNSKPESTWRLIPPDARSPHLHMALDEVLLNRVIRGRRPPTLRFWRWTEPALVLGSHQSVSNEVDL